MRPARRIAMTASAHTSSGSPKASSVELIVIPYEREAEVPHPTKPTTSPHVREIISRGAFDGLERRANRIRANRDHNGLLTFGRATSFHVGHQQGLHAKVRVAHTPLG